VAATATTTLAAPSACAVEPASAAVPSRVDVDPAVVARRVIGHSVRGRPIVAYRLGRARRADGSPTPRVVLMSAMHGDETAPRRILDALRHGPPLVGVDLWVLPTYNPDGVAAHRRQNAHGVDLNRNFPYRWTRITGATDSGPRPASEPETRAVMRFLARVRPQRILSFHQPLDSVGYDGAAPAFSRRVARLLHLPLSHLDCGSSCHGTMTMWFDHRFAGTALTVEYPAHPGARRLRAAARAVLRVFGARTEPDHGTPR
jgi:hypothetical protein